MTHVLHRALPFLMAFVLGVACTAIVRMFLPTHRKAFYDNGRPRCNWKARTNAVPIPVEPMNSGSFFKVDITSVHEAGRTTHSSVEFISNSHEDGWSLKEQALHMRTADSGWNTNYVMSYVSPEAIDGQHVSSNAVVSNIPRPRFWRSIQQHPSLTVDCNVIVRVDLDASGRVSRAEKVPRFDNSCPFTEDILDAARRISFRPALRNGVPVTQRMLILYKLD